MIATFHNKILVLGGFAALALLSTAGVTAAWGKDRAKTFAVQVLSTMAFDGKSTTGMVLREAGGKSYLDVQFSGEGGISTIDVTNPANAKIVNAATPTRESAEERTNVGENLVMVSEKNEEPEAGTALAQEFELWDISQAQKPRLVRQFYGVRRIIEDKRGYIYVLDRDGLSVVRSKQKKGSKSSNGPDFSIYG